MRIHRSDRSTRSHPDVRVRSLARVQGEASEARLFEIRIRVSKRLEWLRGWIFLRICAQSTRIWLVQQRR